MLISDRNIYQKIFLRRFQLTSRLAAKSSSICLYHFSIAGPGDALAPSRSWHATIAAVLASAMWAGSASYQLKISSPERVRVVALGACAAVERVVLVTQVIYTLTKID